MDYPQFFRFWPKEREKEKTKEKTLPAARKDRHPTFWKTTRLHVRPAPPGKDLIVRGRFRDRWWTFSRLFLGGYSLGGRVFRIPFRRTWLEGGFGRQSWRGGNGTWRRGCRGRVRWCGYRAV